jgi:nucleoside-diphosphate-sugar epimerase
MTNRIPGACAVTGATGYVGSIIMRELQQHMPVVAMARHPQSAGDIAWSLESRQEIADTLRARNVKTLVHAAWDMRANSLAEMEKSCVQGSAALFEAATRADVERIVFVSSISAFAGCRSAYGRAKLSVEKLLQGKSNIIFRFGLVFGDKPGSGDKPGGVFGGIRRQVKNSRILPMIGRGLAPQYLLHEKTLAESVLRAVNGDFDSAHGVPITLAHPEPWRFCDLVNSIAASEGRRVTLVPVPWQLLFAGIRGGEALGLKLPFRSDSIVSFIYYDRHPDFSLMHSLGIEPLPYQAGGV